MQTIWVKNKATGLVWEVAVEFGERLCATGEYELADAPEAEPDAKKTKASK